MLQYKIDIISELAKNGINTTTAKKRDIWTRYHAQVQERRYKISLEVLNRLCCVLEMQPRDIIKLSKQKRIEKK